MSESAPRKQLRPRHLYVRRAAGWIGVGEDTNTQPDLFETVYRVGWWRVAVCRVCLIAAIKNASAILDQMETLMTQPRRVPPKKRDEADSSKAASRTVVDNPRREPQGEKSC